MFSFNYGILLCMYCLTFGFLQVQVEAKKGGAKGLPCWRPQGKWKDFFAVRIYEKVTNMNLTGYHVALINLLLVIVHAPFLAGLTWNLAREFEALTTFCIVMLFEDFLWFVLNPHYGLRKFKSEYVDWHRKWIGRIPQGYLSWMVAISVFISLATIIGGKEVLLGFVKALVVLCVFTLGVVLSRTIISK